MSEDQCAGCGGLLPPDRRPKVDFRARGPLSDPGDFPSGLLCVPCSLQLIRFLDQAVADDPAITECNYCGETLLGGFVEYRGEWRSPIIHLSENWKFCKSCAEDIQALFSDNPEHGDDSNDDSDDEAGEEGEDGNEELEKKEGDETNRPDQCRHCSRQIPRSTAAFLEFRVPREEPEFFSIGDCCAVNILRYIDDWTLEFGPVCSVCQEFPSAIHQVMGGINHAGYDGLDSIWEYRLCTECFEEFTAVLDRDEKSHRRAPR